MNRLERWSGGSLLFLVLLAPIGRAETEIITAEIPPYTMKVGGKPRGVVVEIVREMAKRIGHSGEIRFYPWKRALKLAEDPTDKVARLIIPLNRSAAREPLFNWVARILVDETTMVTLKGHRPVVTDLDMAKDWKVGALLGSPLEAELKERKFRNVDAGVDEETNARKLHMKRLDAWLVAGMVAPYIFRNLAFDPSELQLGVKLRKNDLHLAATKFFPEKEAERWRQALAEITEDGTLAKIMEPYVLPAGLSP